MVRLKYEDVKLYIETNSSDKLLDNIYINNSTKLELLCGKCNNSYFLRYANFRAGNRCRKCSTKKYAEKRKHTYEYVRSYIENESGYKLISKEYVSYHKSLDIMCNKGHMYQVKFSNFKTGYRCPYCCRPCKKHTYEYVRDYISSYQYVLLSDNYINERIKIQIRCNNNHIYTSDFSHFVSGKRCPSCAIENRKHSYDYVKNYIESSKGYKLLSDKYVNAQTKICIECNKGHLYYVSFSEFKVGNRCPFCRESKHEKVIEKYLKERNINHIRQYKNNNCKNTNVLRFDFAILDFDNNIKFLLEYDGEYHFLPIINNDVLLNINRNDEIKNFFCKTNEICLVRIPYWESKKIEEILDKWLYKFQLIGGDYFGNVSDKS